MSGGSGASFAAACFVSRNARLPRIWNECGGAAVRALARECGIDPIRGPDQRENVRAHGVEIFGSACICVYVFVLMLMCRLCWCICVRTDAHVQTLASSLYACEVTHACVCVCVCVCV